MMGEKKRNILDGKVGNLAQDFRHVHETSIKTFERRINTLHSQYKIFFRDAAKIIFEMKIIRYSL